MAELTEVQARALFTELHKKLPYNTSSVYIEVDLSDCKLYIPSRFSLPEKQKIEKQHWQNLVSAAKY